MRFVALIALVALAAILSSQPAPSPWVGRQEDGSFLLVSGWRVKPAGQQVPLDTMPMASVLSPDGKYLLVLNAGYRPPSISVMSAASMTELSRVPVKNDAWLGLAITTSGRFVYVGGGSQAVVHEFTFSPEGQLAPARTFVLVPEAERNHTHFTGDVMLSPDGRLLYAAMLHQDAIAVINLQTGRVIERIKTGRRPYRMQFHPDGKSFFVTSWADGSVFHHKAETGERLGQIRLGPHTTDMVWSGKKPKDSEGEPVGWSSRLFVTAGNTNTVFVVGLTDSKDMRLVESINVALTPRHPLGMTPSAVALNPAENRLYVVCSDANTVAVADISEARSRVTGFIPTGWYPTAAHVMPDDRLVVFNGRGERSFPNPDGPSPFRRRSPQHLGNVAVQYVGDIQIGSASVIPPPSTEDLDRYSRTVYDLSPYRDRNVVERWQTADNPFIANRERPSLIQHVIYIVKENRTYDQILGALGKGNGDPKLTLFGEKNAPNHYKLAREFVLFDNFYVNADVSADGHNWATAAIAPDYTQRMWPNSYGGRRRHYDYEGGEPANTPPAGYIWTNVLAAGLSMRNYGYFVENLKTPAADGSQWSVVRDPALATVTSRKYRGYDLEYTDVDRVKVFLSELAEFERTGQMPRFIIMRLGNDHTYGTAPGKLTPQSMVADNDYALGMLVEAVSKSKFWPKTAIFVVEDDAQNGADHVDSHRAPAYILSPFTRRPVVDSTLYNQAAMIRTMGLILGLRPLTHFDGGARPMFAAFSTQANNAPYEASPPQMPLTDRNPAGNPTAARTLRMNFSEADMIDDDEMNEILWLAIKGTEPPAPVRSYFSRRP
jgi:DNA-binding beta-propeller fold protein YncE